MIFWLKQSDTCEIKTKWYLTNVSIVVYWYFDDTWQMCLIEKIFWLKQSDTCVNGGLLNDDILIKTKWYLCSMVVYWMMIFWLKQSDTCVNGGLLNDDTLIKIKWYLEIKMIFWLKQSDSWQMCQ